jgi:hypothetical protein
LLLRHACAVELLKRTKNLPVQQYLRHRDVQSNIVYARLMPAELAEPVNSSDASASILSSVPGASSSCSLDASCFSLVRHWPVERRQ